MSRLYRIFFIALLISFEVSAQRDAQWVLGYNHTGIPNGVSDLFSIDTRTPVTTQILDTVPFRLFVTNSSICDTTGDLLFYTNGFYVMNAEHDTMINGDSLTRGCVNYWGGNDYLGQNLIQSTLILPMPGSSSIYYLIHQGEYNHGSNSILNYWFPLCDTLYYSLIDMNLNNGLGEVLIKNQPFWVGDVATRMLAALGSLTACKHANGRDWWIISHRDTSTEFMNFLLTPQGISGPYFQDIGPLCFQYKGQSVFSRNATKYAFYDFGDNKINLFNFDRCTGQFSNYINITNISNYHFGSIGTAFSPNSRYLYTSLNWKIVQWDTYSSNIASTKTVVAEYDTFYCPTYPVKYFLMELSSNGKIYVSSPNSSYCLSVIENPDIGGLGCNAVSHGFTAPRYIAAGIPNHPNFDLGSVTGSVCDSLTGLDQTEAYHQSATVYPNPSKGNFIIKFPPYPMTGKVSIYNILGELIYDTDISPWTYSKDIKLNTYSKPGLFTCILKWESHSMICKVIVE